jgi:hypothetical protein
MLLFLVQPLAAEDAFSDLAGFSSGPFGREARVTLFIEF